MEQCRFLRRLIYRPPRVHACVHTNLVAFCGKSEREKKKSAAAAAVVKIATPHFFFLVCLFFATKGPPLN